MVKVDFLPYSVRMCAKCMRKMNKLIPAIQRFFKSSQAVTAACLSTFMALTVLTAGSALAQDAVKGDAKAGGAKNAMCIGCHGIAGYQASFPEVYRVPMISGQSAAYIASSLNAYKKGDRKHPSMRSISQSLTDQDMADLAAYYSVSGVVASAPALPDVPSKVPDAQVLALLSKANCASCHGSNYSKPIDPSYPKLAGQHDDYLFVALKAYKTENNAKVGSNNAIMSGIAKQYTNAELKTLAKYLGSVDGQMKVVSQSPFK